MKICRSHRKWRYSFNYIIPSRLTLKCNPKIVVFLVWNFYDFKENNNAI